MSIRSEAVAATKYQQVFETLRRELAEGVYGPGEKLPSEADLVKRFATSRITVGRAVRELQQRDLVERKAGSGTYAKGRPTLGTGQGLAFGLLIPDLGRTEIFEPICQGMAEAPQARHHVLLWGQGQASVDRGIPERRDQAWELCQQYISRRVAGVFFAPLERVGREDKTNQRIIAAFAKARIPVVLIDRDYLPYPQRSGYDLVGIDNRRVGHRITAHLLELGARRPAFVSYANPAATVEERQAGFREALFAAGMAVEAGRIRCLDGDDAATVARLLTELDSDAIVCANDPTAGRLMHGLMALGKRIPEDVRIVGIDDVRYASLLPVPLTTMHQPCREIGMAAMTAMLERISRPDMPIRDILLACPLVVRGSCGAAVR